MTDSHTDEAWRVNMELKLSFEMDNAAFEDGSGGRFEAGRVLAKVIEQLEDGQTAGSCRDTNGNKVGEWSVTE